MEIRNNKKVTQEMNFYSNHSVFDLVNEFGSPLYVYNEQILRERCRQVKNLVKYPHFSVSFSAKANCNLSLLKIVKEEGINVDAMSPGEIYVQMQAGFDASQIFYIGNNVSAEEMKYAIDRGVLVSVDSISQLELFGSINAGGKVAVRFNPGIGAGHNEKVVTAGKKTKFAVDPLYIGDVKRIVEKYNLKLVGINQHIGSLFMDGDVYVESVKSLLEIAEQFDDLDFVDMGGGFGVPYRKQTGEEKLDLIALGQKLDVVIEEWTQKYGKRIEFKIEPGRFIVAESAVILGRVQSSKLNYGTKYVGTDIGFNVLARPIMYNSHHDIEVYSKREVEENKEEVVTVVGNICESGDIIAENRALPKLSEGDLIGVLDAGAYGYAMSSNYNNRLRPAEVLITEDSKVKLIRRRDTFEDLVRNF
jgi:diaminopimelate decarboxylase